VRRANESSGRRHLAGNFLEGKVKAGLRQAERGGYHYLSKGRRQKRRERAFSKKPGQKQTQACKNGKKQKFENRESGGVMLGQKKKAVQVITLTDAASHQVGHTGHGERGKVH